FDRLLPGAADRDLPRLLLGRLRDPQLQHAILVASLDRVAVDALGKGERADERAVRPLDELRLTRLLRNARAGDREDVLVHLDVSAVPYRPRFLDVAARRLGVHEPCRSRPA